jgi:beta-glucosidase
VLLGRAEPGGRLPVTVPAAEADSPVLHATPAGNGVLDYDEGLLIGYRGYDVTGRVPRYPLGMAWGTRPGNVSRSTARRGSASEAISS